MKKLPLICLSFLLCFAFSNIYAQEKTYEVYVGKINNKLNITFVFATIVDGCGSTTYNAMYKYDGRENWIYLNIAHTLKD